MANDQGIKIRTKDRDSIFICTNKETLTKDSQILKNLVDELPDNELEIGDFGADVVILFLKSLEHGQVDKIQDGHFRELHRMSIMYEVEWLRQECCRKLISRMKEGITEDEKLFLFEECLYMSRELQQNDMIDALVSVLSSVDNSLFIEKYLQDFEKLDPIQLDFMLKLGGSNCGLFLQTALKNLKDKEELDENLKLLLQKMNLALCSEADNELYNTVFETISNLPNISVPDLKAIIQLTTETTKSVIMRREQRSLKRGTRLLFDEDDFKELRRKCKTIEDIIDAVSKSQVTSMLLIDLLLEVFYDNPPSNEEMEALAEMCFSKGVQRIPHRYLDMIRSAMEHCPLPQKERLIELLEIVKNNDKLSSVNHNVMITRDRYIVLSPGTEYKHCYYFQHPCYINCSRSDSKCGFLLHYRQSENCWRIKLCVDREDYENTDIHFHDPISAQDMSPYSMFSGTLASGEVISAPAIWWTWWEKWLPDSKWDIKQRCSAFDVSDYLITK